MDGIANGNWFALVCSDERMVSLFKTFMGLNSDEDGFCTGFNG